MLKMTVITDGDGCWPDLKGIKYHHVTDGDIQVAFLDNGMASGKPSVSIRLTLPNGEVVVAETSALLFCSAARIGMVKFPNLFE